MRLNSKGKNLYQKNAIITGCNKGIGKSIMLHFATNGANIWACARTKSSEFEEYVLRLSQENNVSIWPIYMDLADQVQIKEGMKQISDFKKDIDILVNNAGAVLESRSFNMTKIEDMQQIFNVNFFAPVLIMQYISRKMMRKKKGCIINITSIAALDADYGQLEYISSKAALGVATKKIAQELSPYNIRVNAIAPGLVSTRMLDNMNDEMKETTLQKIFLKRLGCPDDIANTAVFLASDQSSYINAQTIRVDGGL